MKISSVSPQIIANTRSQSFGEKTKYENPIDRSTERNLAILSSVGGSLGVGAAAAGITAFLKTQKGYKLPAIIGGAVAAIGLALTLPSALYNSRVGSFTREKEMDAFSRSAEAKSSILEGVNEQIKDDEVDLKEKVDNYAKVQLANQGKGMMITN